MKEYSGKFVLRLLPSLHKDLSLEALSRSLSLNQLINEKLMLSSSNGVDFHLIEKYFKKDLLGLMFFGSFARKQSFKMSDKDLLIVLQSYIPIKRNLYQIWQDQLSKDFQSISPHFTHLPNTNHLRSLWLEVALEGEIVFDRDHQLLSSILNIRREIAQGKYRRKQAHGHPYWLKIV